MTKSEPLTESYFYILLCLAKEPMHGYGIMRETERLSDGMVKIGSGTMYGATSNMMKKKWIAECKASGPGMERKRMYELTGEGRKALEEEICRLKRMVRGAEEILWEDRRTMKMNLSTVGNA